ncbi:hypothetical protein [Desulfatibacillum aliphaticivorans]|uniref:hypothetical protein n=1 Tax=Desulfatibacillum aliphaticivorans TaxID=218208 RepID=UPI0014723934|nr:hypothetical protein [Desulfatibacillum aliphaticivorans]
MPGMRQYFICTLALILALSIGCGKKGPPRAPHTQPPAPACGLEAEMLEDSRVRLTWNQAGCVAGGKVDGFAVFMAREKLDKEACKNCPMNFQRIATVHVGKFNPWQTQSDKAVHMTPVLEGFRYIFKVTAFGPGGEAQDSERVSVEAIPAAP